MPLVEFRGDEIEFPFSMGMDEVQDVLGATASGLAATAEFVATLATGAVAESASGLAGLATGNIDNIGKVQSMLTYQPRTQAGIKAMQRISEDIGRLSEETGVNHVAGYWKNRVVPALQQQAGPVAGSVLAAAGLGALAFVGEVGGGGSAARGMRRMGTGEGGAIKAFHGSPHDFDEFKMSQIGTGEGAQAYGHGLYFAEDEAVATGYKLALEKGSKEVQAADRLGMGRTYETDLFTKQLADNDGDITKTQSQLKGYAESFKQDGDWDSYNNLMGLHKRVGEKYPDGGNIDLSDAPGKVYEVDIDANPDEFLDWDLPLGEQSEGVKKIAADNRLERSASGMKENTGAGLYQALGQRNADSNFDSSSLRGADIYANPILQAQGIKGIKYKDGFSRGATGGTSNYVIFDDRLITIAKKYGIAMPAAAALLADQTGEDTSKLFEQEPPSQQNSQGINPLQF